MDYEVIREVKFMTLLRTIRLLFGVAFVLPYSLFGGKTFEQCREFAQGYVGQASKIDSLEKNQAFQAAVLDEIDSALLQKCDGEMSRLNIEKDALADIIDPIYDTCYNKFFKNGATAPAPADNAVPTAPAKSTQGIPVFAPLDIKRMESHSQQGATCGRWAACNIAALVTCIRTGLSITNQEVSQFAEQFYNDSGHLDCQKMAERITDDETVKQAVLNAPVDPSGLDSVAEDIVAGILHLTVGMGGDDHYLHGGIFSREMENNPLESDEQGARANGSPIEIIRNFIVRSVSPESALIIPFAIRSGGVSEKAKSSSNCGHWLVIALVKEKNKKPYIVLLDSSATTAEHQPTSPRWEQYLQDVYKKAYEQLFTQ